jgi:NADH-quinone oxidoreductase subunit N
MFLNDWIENATGPLWSDLLAFSPELILCFTIVLMLLMRLSDGRGRSHMGLIALFGVMFALVVSVQQWLAGVEAKDVILSAVQWLFDQVGILSGQPSVPQDHGLRVIRATKPTDIFTGLLVYDNFTIFLRLFLLSFTALVVWLTLLTRIPDREDSADFYTLLLGAIVGMSIMASANHLLMVFIGVEMASLPSYALAGFLKGKRQSSEAALKYVVYGGGASGIMLYGISLLAGKFGTAYLPDLAKGFTAIVMASTSQASSLDPLLIMGVLFVLIGIGFKLAAVPFHFWCPDVFEGAAAEVAGFLSVASKGAALALLGRFVLVLAGLGDVITTHFEPWLKMAQNLVPALAVFAALTATFGNLAAYMQTNLKRLLAYSTIAHAGYMLMGLATLMPEGASAVLFYLIAYLVMNLGAFAVVAFLRNLTGSEDLRDFRGLVLRAPLLVVTLAFFLFSLLGVPPLAGFAAKFQIFRVLFDAGNLYAEKGAPYLSRWMYALLVIGGINTVISLVYYVKVLKVMVLDRPVEYVEGKELPPLPVPYGASLYAVFLAAAVLVLGVLWDPLAYYSDKGVDRFAQIPRQGIRKPAEEARPTMMRMGQGGRGGGAQPKTKGR